RPAPSFPWQRPPRSNSHARNGLCAGGRLSRTRPGAGALLPSGGHDMATDMGMGTPMQAQMQMTRPEHTEGAAARTIEQQTAKLPSDLFVWAAGACVVGSLLLQFSGKQHESLFIGQWVPTLLILGLYNKLVKVAGSDPVQIGR